MYSSRRQNHRHCEADGCQDEGESRRIVSKSNVEARVLAKRVRWARPLCRPKVIRNHRQQHQRPNYYQKSAHLEKNIVSSSTSESGGNTAE